VVLVSMLIAVLITGIKLLKGKINIKVNLPSCSKPTIKSKISTTCLIQLLLFLTCYWIPDVLLNE